MKNLIFIGGAWGTGKTTVAHLLTDKLKSSIMLDGDWTAWKGFNLDVWDNWNKCKQNTDMQIKNICFLLNSFMSNSNIENIIFSWVLCNEKTHKDILKSIGTYEFNFYNISLVCDKDTLYDRILKREILDHPDLSIEKCKQQINKFYNKSLNVLENYNRLNTIKINTSKLDKEEVISEILKILK